jgi:hypothetical protein
MNVDTHVYIYIYIYIFICFILASFLNVTLVAGTVRTFGILYAELLEVYDGGSGNTAFMGSLLLFTFAITGKYDGQVFIISFKCHNSYIYH